MTYGTVEFRLGGRVQTATLGENGWIFQIEGIVDALNMHCHPSRYGPADGNPCACAVACAADLLGGKGYVVPLESMSEGTIY